MSHARRPSQLSPSRANDFQQCPLLYRYRSVDRLPEPPSTAQVAGTLVHSALEDLFRSAPGERTPETALQAVATRWKSMQDSLDLNELFPSAGELDEWKRKVRGHIETYFRLEAPDRLRAESLERLVTTQLDGDTPAKGFIDRVEVNDDGMVRLTDYKTGKCPPPRFQDKALFQMRFYALVWWRVEGTIPATLRLVYLGDGKILDHRPSSVELEDFESEVARLWKDISAAIDTGIFPPRKSRLCDWCHFQQYCPEFGGNELPYPLTTVLA
ncbi:RecB family exonuclease [Haloglycomyces albus]|uniref:RecB family exonuclease n=1 Tax=Haloglycomyces albus TaxID=526067 RepID=UPI00046D8A70|nr:PD-(D/E)XK nuclease family protein [Haloglycomyces albus]